MTGTPTSRSCSRASRSACCAASAPYRTTLDRRTGAQTGAAPASAAIARCVRAQRTHTPCPLQLRSSHQQQPGKHRECACQRLSRTMCPCPTYHSTVPSAAAALVALAAVAREPQGVRLPAPLPLGVSMPNAPQHRDLRSCARLISSSSQVTTGSAPASASPARCARAQRTIAPCPLQLRSSHQQQLPENHRGCACQRRYRTVCPCPTHHSTVPSAAALFASAAAR